MNRGEIWFINLDPTIGAEIRKSRPAVIVSRDSIGKLPLKIIVPITAWDDRFADAPWHIQIPPGAVDGISKISSADTFQVRSVSEKRFVRKLGDLPANYLREIEKGLALSLQLD